MLIFTVSNNVPLPTAVNFWRRWRASIGVKSHASHLKIIITNGTLSVYVRKSDAGQRCHLYNIVQISHSIIPTRTCPDTVTRINDFAKSCNTYRCTFSDNVDKFCLPITFRGKIFKEEAQSILHYLLSWKVPLSVEIDNTLLLLERDEKKKDGIPRYWSHADYRMRKRWRGIRSRGE